MSNTWADRLYGSRRPKAAAVLNRGDKVSSNDIS